MFLLKSWKYKCKARPLVCGNRCCKGLLNDWEDEALQIPQLRPDKNLLHTSLW